MRKNAAASAGIVSASTNTNTGIALVNIAGMSTGTAVLRLTKDF